MTKKISEVSGQIRCVLVKKKYNCWILSDEGKTHVNRIDEVTINHNGNVFIDSQHSFEKNKPTVGAGNKNNPVSCELNDRKDIKQRFLDCKTN